MAMDTTRDKAWKFALNATHTTGGKITTARLVECSEASERTARDVLQTMAQYGALVAERDGNGMVYHANPDYFTEYDGIPLDSFEEVADE